jgi:hypothetical protein
MIYGAHVILFTDAAKLSTYQPSHPSPIRPS